MAKTAAATNATAMLTTTAMIATEHDGSANGGQTFPNGNRGHLGCAMVNRRAIVIGVDGLRWDRVNERNAPRLTKLAGSGLFAPSLLDVSSGTRTDSGPGWSTIATGVWPDKHGVLDNDFVGARYGQYPDFLTRLARADPARRTFAAVDWPPLAQQGTFGPEIGDLVVGDGEKRGYPPEDERMTAAAIAGLRHSDAMFVYLGCVDIAGHRTGALSTEYSQAIERVDRMVGQLLDAIDTEPGHWLTIVTTDHGHRDEGNHGGYSDHERATFILAAGSDVPAGRRDDALLVDLAPTVLDHFGVPVPAELDGRSLLG
jgi:predicted AlkP superfamily phosphohydrolase/phosphomutase